MDKPLEITRSGGRDADCGRDLLDCEILLIGGGEVVGSGD